jgi:hypothetical protein
MSNRGPSPLIERPDRLIYVGSTCITAATISLCDIGVVERRSDTYRAYLESKPGGRTIQKYGKSDQESGRGAVIKVRQTFARIPDAIKAG